MADVATHPGALSKYARALQAEHSKKGQILLGLALFATFWELFTTPEMEHPGLNITDIPHQALETSLPLWLDTPRPTFPLLLSRSAPGLEPAALGQAKAWSGSAPAGLACLKSREEPGLAETCWCLTHTHRQGMAEIPAPYPHGVRACPKILGCQSLLQPPGGQHGGDPPAHPHLGSTSPTAQTPRASHEPRTGLCPQITCGVPVPFCGFSVPGKGAEHAEGFLLVAAQAWVSPPSHIFLQE